jgi:predicted lipid-binding transport protein (Tim44 family)
VVARIRGILLIVLLVVVLLAIGTGIVQGIGLIFGGIGLGSSIFFGFVLVVAVIGVLVLLGRRRQARAQAARAAQPGR